MATNQSVERETDTSQGTVLSDRIGCVFGATRQETASGWQQRRHEQLIRTNRGQQGQTQYPCSILPLHLTTPADARPALVVPTSIRRGNGLALPRVAAD
jgi:hypothetical protein